LLPKFNITLHSNYPELYYNDLQSVVHVPYQEITEKDNEDEIIVLDNSVDNSEVERIQNEIDLKKVLNETDFELDENGWDRYDFDEEEEHDFEDFYDKKYLNGK